MRRELEQLGSEYRNDAGSRTLSKLVESILPGRKATKHRDVSLDELLNQFGFDREQHEQIQADLKSGRFGLSQNRLPPSTSLEDVDAEHVVDCRNANSDSAAVANGQAAIAAGEVAVVTLAAGVGSRWTEGAGVVKGLHPFAQMNGQHRSFLEVHLAKSCLLYTSPSPRD